MLAPSIDRVDSADDVSRNLGLERREETSNLAMREAITFSIAHWLPSAGPSRRRATCPGPRLYSESARSCLDGMAEASHSAAILVRRYGTHAFFEPANWLVRARLLGGLIQSKASIQADCLDRGQSTGRLSSPTSLSIPSERWNG